MHTNIDIDAFVKKHVTKRQSSLLNPDLIKYNQKLKEGINDKSVLIIGGAGSIGSSYIKAILKFKIRELVVVDINENGLTELVRDIRSSTNYHIPDIFITYPINFGDFVFEKFFRNHGQFHIVANFAAHKHVRSEKDVYSIEAMFENNLLRARNLLNLILEFPPEHFFCVSTDKAANPVNLMGASKKLMEELIMAYSSSISISTARFANVAFSNGSLPLGFIERLQKRQPWSCPNNIRRFFVSLQESGELCLLASILGETGDIFFPKLDEGKDMILFSQIAIDLIHQLGLEPDICQTEEEARRKALLLNEFSTTYPIYFFDSNTSGEKPYEEFFTSDEDLDLDSFINIGVIKNSKKRNFHDIDHIFHQLTDLFSGNNVLKSDIINIIQTILPNFNHIETGRNLDIKM